MKRLAAMILAAALLLAAGTYPAFADTMTGGDWYCRFTEEEGMDSNFNMSATGMADVLSGLQPGDDAVFHMQLENLNEKDTDWYMTNEVLQSLESSKTAAEGGVYSYDLRYVDPDGAEDVLYSSASVGGEGKTLTDRVGLHEATSALEDFFYLDTLSQGESGYITLRVALEGETQGNAYQDTLARLQMNFAVEISRIQPDDPDDPDDPDEPGATVPTTPPGGYRPVRTGDETNLLLWSAIMFACGLGVLVLALVSMRRSKKHKGEDKDA